MSPRDIILLIDLTSLNESDTNETIKTLCRQALTPLGPVAAVCIYPKHVAFAKKTLLGASVGIATVANFPHGNGSAKDCITEIKFAMQAGADEIDVVMPYHDYLKGKIEDTSQFLQTCRDACAGHIYKVILETGALGDVNVIRRAAELAIEAGADFIKTSTGKTTVGATLQAAEVILNVIKQFPNKTVGLKISGGVRTCDQAMEYINLAVQNMGRDWITPRTMRFGASQLLQDILRH